MAWYDQDFNGNDAPRAGQQDPNTISLYDAVANLYRSALGREASPDEINAQIQANSGDLSSIHQGILSSDEYKARLNAPAPNQAAPTTTPEQPSPTYGTGGGAPAAVAGPGVTPTPFNFPTFNAPSATPGTPFTAPPAFSYEKFNAPTLEQAQNEPGYAFALEQGRKALENSAAAKGILRSGGTLKDLFSWGNKFAEQNYGDVFNRAKSIYDTNYNNAADAYKTNYGISSDVFSKNEAQRNTGNEYNYRAALDQFNPVFEASRMQYGDLYNRWRDLLNADTSKYGANLGALSSVIGAGA